MLQDTGGPPGPRLSLGGCTVLVKVAHVVGYRGVLWGSSALSWGLHCPSEGCLCCRIQGGPVGVLSSLLGVALSL
ncbi:hypothetical protein GDO81_020522 [Engystomops pustulosus]|uniref:Uncharacterized protein n=1 Tax=Engystomops pustulosus TaxID=76066 RepID=A0AAV6ZIH8_ENGPU|nr:hypothetical protein GDO81_020522 [Engystomops pustulosus]